MKKFFIITTLCFGAIFLSACTTQEQTYDRQDTLLTPEVADEFNVVLPNSETEQTDTAEQNTASTENSAPQMGEQSTELHETFDPNAVELEAPVSSDVDIDLTQMSSTLVYAQVYDLLANTDAYVGQTIRMSGTYNSFGHELTGEFLHFIVVADATECCAQGLEFFLPKGSIYPQTGQEVEVIGTIRKMQEVRGDETFDYLTVEGITYDLIG